MNNKVILLILLASIVIQLVMLFTKKFATSIFISGGTLAVIALFKIYDASSRRRIKARTIDEERSDIARRGGNPTFVDWTKRPGLVVALRDNEDETFETPPQSLRSSQTTSDADSDELSRGSSTWNPEQQTNEKSVMQDQQETAKIIQDLYQTVFDSAKAVREDLTNGRL